MTCEPCSKNGHFPFQGQYDIRSLLRYASNKEKEGHPGSAKLICNLIAQELFKLAKFVELFDHLLEGPLLAG